MTVQVVSEQLFKCVRNTHLGDQPGKQVVIHAAMAALGRHDAHGRVSTDHVFGAAGRFARAAVADDVPGCESALADLEKLVLRHQPGDAETLRRIDACSGCVTNRQFVLVDEVLTKSIAAEKAEHFAATYVAPVLPVARDYSGREISGATASSPIGGHMGWGSRVVNGIAAVLR